MLGLVVLCPSLKHSTNQQVEACSDKIWRLMKIDFDALDAMVTAGATGSVIVAYLRAQHDRKAPRRAKDKVRKRAERVRTSADKVRMDADSSATAARDQATLSDTPHARLFREGRPALVSLGIAEGRAGGLIGTWLKLTNNDHQLVLSAILEAQRLAVADAPGYILATLKGKLDGNRSRSTRRQSAGNDFFEGLRSVAEDLAGDSAASGQGTSEIPLGRLNIDG